MLHQNNEEILEKIVYLDEDNELSNPLLVSPKINGKIMYIGQETNRWWGLLKENGYSASDLERFYEDFFLKNNVNNGAYWRFIKGIINKTNISDDIVWTNILIAGKAFGKGKPSICDKLIDLSVKNLIAIYEYAKIEKIICVCGPNNPYYDIFMKFLSEIGKQVSNYPHKCDRIIYSSDDSVLYTYHPQYLKRIKQFDKVEEKAKIFVKKGSSFGR